MIIERAHLRLGTVACVAPSALDALLDEDQSLDPVTAEGLSNHLSMGLVGLARLGADDGRLHGFAADWRTRLVDRHPGLNPIGPGDWAACLGTGRRYSDLLSFFTGAIEQDGVTSTLSDVLGTLLDGVGGAAFHGVIRLAYALEHARPSDIACGLAYLADVHDPVTPSAASQIRSVRGASVSDVLSALGDDPGLAGRQRTPGSFSDQFHAVAIDDSFLQLIGQLEVDESTLAQTAAAAHALYRSSGNFYALHTVTATHAARIAIDRLEDDDQRIRAAGALARAVAAAYVAIGTPSVMVPIKRDDPVKDVPAWADIAAAAIASDDVHTIKMAYSCREEQVIWGDMLYQLTAAEVVGLM